MNVKALETIKQLDPEFYDRVSRDSEYAYRDVALPAKVKLLIALALDAAHGAAGGVEYFARQAIAKGATKEEIMEAVHVAGHISGAGSVYTASFGLADIFK